MLGGVKNHVYTGGKGLLDLQSCYPPDDEGQFKMTIITGVILQFTRIRELPRLTWWFGVQARQEFQFDYTTYSKYLTKLTQGTPIITEIICLMNRYNNGSKNGDFEVFQNVHFCVYTSCKQVIDPQKSEFESQKLKFSSLFSGNYVIQV